MVPVLVLTWVWDFRAGFGCAGLTVPVDVGVLWDIQCMAWGFRGLYYWSRISKSNP